MKGIIATLQGDGIGREIMTSALRVLEAVNTRFGHTFETREGAVGSAAYDASGVHLPPETISICEQSDAILFGAVGGPVADQESPRWKDAEKNVILGLRKKFDLFANLRPLKVWPGTEGFSSLKPEAVRGMDVLIVRELVSGIYFGTHERIDENTAEDVNRYTKSEIERVVRVAFEAAMTRRKKLTVVDKANVLETSRLWREVANAVKKDFPDVAMEFMFVDNAAMQLVRNPTSFDVIVTENMFGDILSDLGGAIVGSLGLLPSASLSAKGGSASGGKFGLYEPSHGSAPDIAGKGTANPTAQILSLALLLRYTFDLQKEADAIEAALLSAWTAGEKTADLSGNLSTDEFTSCVVKRLNA
jgi:3-isopropylmalate dehydrogenase